MPDRLPFPEKEKDEELQAYSNLTQPESIFFVQITKKFFHISKSETITPFYKTSTTNNFSTISETLCGLKGRQSESVDIIEGWEELEEMISTYPQSGDFMMAVAETPIWEEGEYKFGYCRKCLDKGLLIKLLEASIS